MKVVNQSLLKTDAHQFSLQAMFSSCPLSLFGKMTGPKESSRVVSDDVDQSSSVCVSICMSLCAHGCLNVCLQMKVGNAVFTINDSITKPLLLLVFDILSCLCLLHVSLSCTGKSFILTRAAFLKFVIAILCSEAIQGWGNSNKQMH